MEIEVSVLYEYSTTQLLHDVRSYLWSGTVYIKGFLMIGLLILESEKNQGSYATNL